MRIENYQFGNQTLSYNNVISNLETHGNPGNDNISASFFAEDIYGYEGNDTITINSQDKDDTSWRKRTMIHKKTEQANDYQPALFFILN